MARMQGARASWLCGICMLWAGAAGSQPLTAERAVQIALEKSTQIVNAKASVVDARGGLYGAYSGVLPSLSASWSRAGSLSKDQTGSQTFGALSIEANYTRQEAYSARPTVFGSWSVLNLSNLRSLSSARSGLKASEISLEAARSDVAFETRSRFFDTVSSYHLAAVADAAVKLSRDDERRVRALFEVGSVSRSDLLRAQVRTASSQLDSITAHEQVVRQRVSLAVILAIPESQLGMVDTVLTADTREYTEAAILDEASKNRPDLRAAQADLHSAKAGLSAANMLRLPYVTVSGSADFTPDASATTTIVGDSTTSSQRTTDRVMSGQIALTWDLFTGFQTESRISQARARVLRAQESYDALKRGLEGEVHETLVAYREAAGREHLASRTLESALENLKLTQQKYNVGSATILDLIDAQVSLTRAAAIRVQALASIRVAEAGVNRVRGQVE